MFIEFFDYEIKLSSGDILSISEVDIDRISDKDLLSVIKTRQSPLDWVPYITRSVMEEAKLGYDTNFKKSIGIEPIAQFKRLPTNLCYFRKKCASYEYEACLMKPKSKSRRAKEFPPCWMIDQDNEKERFLITSMIFKWRDNFRVIIVVPDDYFH